MMFLDFDNAPIAFFILKVVVLACTLLTKRRKFCVE